jgi:hypothetical protein
VENKVPVQVCRMVPEEVVRKVPVTTCKMAYEERVEQEPVRVCRQVAVSETVRIPQCVERRVPVTYTYRVPHTIVNKIPLDPCGNDLVPVAVTSSPVMVTPSPVTVVPPSTTSSSQTPKLAPPPRPEDATTPPALNPNDPVPGPIDENSPKSRSNGPPSTFAPPSDSQENTK